MENNDVNRALGRIEGTLGGMNHELARIAAEIEKSELRSLAWRDELSKQIISMDSRVRENEETIRHIKRIAAGVSAVVGTVITAAISILKDYIFRGA